MDLGTIIMFQIICLICRCIIFKKRDVSIKKAILPGVNKYWLGRLVKNKKLGIANCIAQVGFWIYFWFCFGLELWIIQNYTEFITVPTDNNAFSRVEVALPENIANLAIYSKYVLIAFAVITIILWCMMMWKFTILHKRSPWWICLWAVIPVIPYIYFACISDVVSIDGKRYSIKKVEIKQ